ncbi:hypothetical protein [Chitinophaga pinensis]|uniref:hypothetical protein n=1 Tax=Chitinophaga pinensis TaxID=79329 RepID=UPI001648D863|nr:hypothetical protein [Chitinophaga pinensis]
MKVFIKSAAAAMFVISAALSANAQSYIQDQTTSAQNANFWISGYGKTSNGLWLAKDGADVAITGIRITNFAETRGANFQLTNGSTPGLATWVHDGTTWVERMRIASNGWVGIGTTTPGDLFEVKGAVGSMRFSKDGNGISFNRPNANYIVANNPGGFFIFQTGGGNERMRIDSTGNVGFGVTVPVAKVDIGGLGEPLRVSRTGAGTWSMTLTPDPTGAGSSLHMNSLTLANRTSTGDFAIATQSTGQPTFVVKQNGNVGIGTTDPKAYKLAVEGTIGARKIKVTQQVGWADFVFEPDYKLPSLSEVEQFIIAHKHLPDVPSAKEVAKEGVDLGEMNKILLQKIEELTLHMIELQKEVKELKAVAGKEAK